MSENVDLASLLAAKGRALVSELYTSMPGEVVAYDPATQRATVQPTVKVRALDEDDEEVEETLPPIANVPVQFPAGGSFALTFPLAAGDPVTLVFSMVSAAEYLSTGQIAAPADRRLHSLNYPVALPGALPETKKLTDAHASELRLGRRGTTAQVAISSSEIRLGTDATMAVALAPLVQAELALIGAHLAALPTPPTPPTPPYVPNPAGVAATMVKAK